MNNLRGRRGWNAGAEGGISMARATEMAVDRAQAGLSSASRWLTRVVAVAYLLLGLVMFAFPDWSAHHFPWKVSSFVAITLGSYLLGNAWIAAVAQHTWTFASVYSLLIYLWLFGVLETVVVLIHRDKLITGAVLTVPYLIMLGLTVIAAVAGVADWIRRRPPLRSAGMAMPGWVRGLLWAFVIVVAFIAAGVLYGPASAHDGRYFPQPLSSFTLGALGVFYLSLSLSVLVMVRQPRIAAVTTNLRGTVVLVAVIVIATLVYIGIFHFGAHPRRIVYLGTYLVVLVGAIAILVWHRRLSASQLNRPARLSSPQIERGRTRYLTWSSQAR
jgi:hypothetical protein